MGNPGNGECPEKEELPAMQDDFAPAGDSSDNAKKWSETCIGVWTRSTTGDETAENTEMVCTGINLVRIGKAADLSKVSPSQTRGIQITVTETRNNQEFKDDDVGADGVIGYHPPLQSKGRRLQEKALDQPTPVENLVNYYAEKKDRLVRRLYRYKEDPSEVTEIWGELVAGSKKQYQTGKRLLSYCRPKEMCNHMYNFANERIKGLKSWFGDDKKGKS